MDNATIRQHLSGISAVAVAPFGPDGAIDPSGVETNIEHLVSGGITSIVIGGNVGEYFALTAEELDILIDLTVEAVAGRDVLVIAGVGRDAVSAGEAARRAADLGAHAVMVHEPPHPHTTADGLCNYYQRVNDASPVPLIPYVRREWLEAEDIVALARRIDCLGAKFAINDPPKLAQVTSSCPDVLWVCGTAELWAPFLHAAGAQGFTSGIVNITTRQPLALLAALASGDHSAALATWSTLAPFERLRAEAAGGFNISVVKDALQQVGRSAGEVRPPGTPVGTEQHRAITAILEQWELL